MRRIASTESLPEDLAREIEAMLTILLRRGVLPEEDQLEAYRAYRQDNPRKDA